MSGRRGKSYHLGPAGEVYLAVRGWTHPTIADVFSRFRLLMGNSPSHSALADSLKTLLRAKKIKVSKSVLVRFLGCVDFFAPWFAHTGQVTLISWEKLGKDLRRTADDPREPDLDPIVLPLWELIRACLLEERSVGTDQPALTAVREVLEEVRSQSSDTARDLMHFKETGCQTSLPTVDSECNSASSESEGEEGDFPLKSRPPSYTQLRQKLEAASTRPLVPTAPPTTLSPVQDPGGPARAFFGFLRGPGRASGLLEYDGAPTNL